MNSDFKKSYEETVGKLRVVKTPEQLKAICSRAHTLLDEAFSKELSLSEMKLACCEGCHYCCHIKVDVQPKDIFLIADFIRKRFSPEKQTEVLQKAHANWAKIESMTLDQHLDAGLTCPLLENGKCSVYALRPDSCREAHSLRSEPCKNVFENPKSKEDFCRTNYGCKTGY